MKTVQRSDLPLPVRFWPSGSNIGGTSTSCACRASSGYSGSSFAIFPEPPLPVVYVELLRAGVVLIRSTLAPSFEVTLPAGSVSTCLAFHRQIKPTRSTATIVMSELRALIRHIEVVRKQKMVVVIEGDLEAAQLLAGRK